LHNDPVIRRLCVERASSGQIRDYALRYGMTTLRQSGWERVLAGTTSVEEILRITKGDLVAMDDDPAANAGGRT
jgi:type II secretory ATPase GspE/PulE/Tfp pilus assembly ATPase PilB-like protein